MDKYDIIITIGLILLVLWLICFIRDTFRLVKVIEEESDELVALRQSMGTDGEDDE